MTVPKLSCPNAVYVSGMKINCKLTGGRCTHVFYKSCKGWWALSPEAKRCPLREGSNGKA